MKCETSMAQKRSIFTPLWPRIYSWNVTGLWERRVWKLTFTWVSGLSTWAVNILEQIRIL